MTCELYYFQHMLAKHYIEILCLGKDSPDAMKLLNFRAPKNAKGVSIVHQHFTNDIIIIDIV